MKPTNVHTKENEPPSSKWTLKKVLVNLLKLGLGVLAIYLIVQKVDVQKVGFYLKQAKVFYLLLAFLAFFVSKAIAALRVNCYYRTQGLHISELYNLKLSLLAAFYSLFIPMIGGEGYKVYWLNREFKTSVKSLIWASLLDRVSGLAALLCLAMILLQFTDLEFEFKTIVLLGIPLMYIAYIVIHRWFWKSFQAAWKMVNVYALAVQILQVVCTLFILMALGVEAGRMEYLFVFLLSCLAYVLPFIGAREMAFVFGADFLGLDPELSLAISLFFYLSLAVTSLSGLFFLLFPSYLKAS